MNLEGKTTWTKYF